MSPFATLTYFAGFGLTLFSIVMMIKSVIKLSRVTNKTGKDEHDLLKATFTGELIIGIIGMLLLCSTLQLNAILGPEILPLPTLIEINAEDLTTTPHP